MCPRKVVHGARRQGLTITMLLGLVAVGRGEVNSWPASFVEDADLQAATFVDARHGWAVGDRGAIWHTRDGGQRWERQVSPTTASLHGVSFIDERRGWIVGGAAIPYTDRGYGVVLRTDDGGTTWIWERRVELPFLRGVHFHNPQAGFAVGDGSPLFPAGIYTTRDAGRTWNPIALRGSHGWTAAAMQNQGGVAISRQGEIVTFDAQQGLPANVPPHHHRMRAVAALDARTLFAVGDRAQLWISHDAGSTWLDISDRLAAWKGVDLLAIACQGAHVWLGGAMGNRLLYSADGGQTWQSVATEVATPITDIGFNGSDHGWAVGQLGCILTTQDGGQTWNIVAGRGRRIALLGIFATADDIPWTALAQASSVYDARCRLVVLEQDPDLPFSLPFEERLQQAALRCGANNAGSWTEFPLGDTRVGMDGTVVAEHWQQRHRLRSEPLAGVDWLRQRIQQELAQWQPDMILTGHLRSSSSERRDADIRRLIQIVIQEEATRAHCRMLRTCPAPQPMSINVAASELSLPLGSSVGQIAAAAAAYLEHTPQEPPPLMALESLVGGRGGTNILSGVANEPGGPARRPPSPAAAEDWHELQQRTQQYANAQALIEQAARAPEKASAWQAQIESMIAGLTQDEAARLLYATSHGHLRSGNWDAALQSLAALVRRDPHSQLGRVATVDALRIVCSAEAGHLRQARSSAQPATQVTSVAQVTHESTDARDARAIPIDELVKTGPTIEQQLQAAQATRPYEFAGETANVWDVGYWSEKLDPSVRAEPEVTFAIEAHRRRIRRPGIRQQAVYKRLARTALTQSWRISASAELALLQPEREVLKSTCQLHRGQRPRLDGQLDDLLWQQATAITLQNHHDNLLTPASTACVKLAYDDAFLYVALLVGREPSIEYPPASRTRQRDSDLDRYDRVELQIDIDRDYATAWQLTIDHRGWANECFLQNESWDPTWYIGVAPEESARDPWVVEAALPWSSLGGSRPTADSPWCVTIGRMIPGIGRQTWPPDSGQLSDAGFLWCDE